MMLNIYSQHLRNSLKISQVKEKNRILNNLQNDKTRSVLFSESFGGSENQLRLLFKYIPDEYFENVNLILNNSDPNLLDPKRKNILWMQHFVNQKEAQNLSSKEYLNRIDYIIFNSNWNFEKFQYQFKIPENKSIVIRNAIEKIEIKEKKKDRINLVYHSTPWRGLKVLIEIFKKNKFQDVELHVCSSTEIYGSKFKSNNEKKFTSIFDDCKTVNNIVFHSYLENNKVIELLKDMHIFSYPCIWHETSCIASIEAMAAGCEVVTTNLGALFETCSPFATFVGIDTNMNDLEKKYTETLKDKIENFWSDENQKKLKLQADTINYLYSWDFRKKEWTAFLNKLK